MESSPPAGSDSQKRPQRRFWLFKVVSWLARVLPRLPWENWLNDKLNTTGAGRAETWTAEVSSGPADRSDVSDSEMSLNEVLAEVNLEAAQFSADLRELPRNIQELSSTGVKVDVHTHDQNDRLDRANLDFEFDRDLDADQEDQHELEDMIEKLNSALRSSSDQAVFFRAEDEQSLQEKIHQSRRARGATPIKLREDRRDRERARRRKKSQKARAERRSRAASSEQIATDQAPPTEERPSLITEHKRPPLRDYTKWQQLGATQLNLWQRYSPSSKSLLFGSWLSSLEKLVEVHELAAQDRDQFFTQVAEYDELSALSPTELDAWWFQLNRVDHFITEFHFQRRLSEQAHLFLRTPSLAQVKEKETSEAQMLTSSQEAGPLSETPQADLPAISVWTPEYDEADLIEMEQSAQEASLTTPIPTTTGRHRTMSFDLTYDRSRSLEEDVILKPVTRRKRNSSR